MPTCLSVCCNIYLYTQPRHQLIYDPVALIMLISYASALTHYYSHHCTCSGFFCLFSLPYIFCFCCYFFTYHVLCCLVGLAVRVTLVLPPNY
jgi:hypothetical protein